MLTQYARVLKHPNQPRLSDWDLVLEVLQLSSRRVTGCEAGPALFQWPDRGLEPLVKPPQQTDGVCSRGLNGPERLISQRGRRLGYFRHRSRSEKLPSFRR